MGRSSSRRRQTALSQVHLAVLGRPRREVLRNQHRQSIGVFQGRSPHQVTFSSRYQEIAPRLSAIGQSLDYELVLGVRVRDTRWARAAMLAMQVVAKLATMMWTSSLIIALSRLVFFSRLGMPMAFRPTLLRTRAGVQVSRHSCCRGQALETVRRRETKPAEYTRSLTA